MMRSRLPVPSLLCLFGALLMLSPELLMGSPDFSSINLADPRVKKVVAFVVEKYNKDRIHNSNYFKQLGDLEVMSQEGIWVEYLLLVDLVETTCEKKAFSRMAYKMIQKCDELTENQKKQTCFFRVLTPSRYRTVLANNFCT